MRPDRRDRIDFEGAGDVVCSSSVVKVVVVAVDFSVALAGIVDELCRRVKNDGEMRGKLPALGLQGDSATSVENP